MTTVSSPVQAPRYRFVVEGALLWIQVAMGLSFIAVAPLFPLIIDDYGIDNATASLLIGGTALAFAVSTIPGGMIAAKFGWWRATFFGGLLMSAMVLSPFAANFTILLTLRLMFAAGGATVMGALPSAVMSWFPLRELPVVNGTNIVGQSIGVTISVFSVAFIADLVGWRESLMLFGVVGLVGVGVFVLLARTPEVPVGAPVGTPFSVGMLGAAFRHVPTLLLGVGIAGGVAAFIGLNSWLPTYYQQEWGWTLERAGQVVAIPSFFGIVGSLLGSALPVGIGLRRPLIILAGVVMPVAVFGSFISESPLILFPSLAMLGLVSWIHFPSVITMPMEFPGATLERATLSVATLLTIGNVSGFFSPLMVGLLRDQTGSFGLGFTICVFFPLTLVVAGLLVPETGPRGRPRRAAATENPDDF
ncbi:MAG: MFS transporter [Chloroflexi bacterium]|nr:MFS transporter [Chloroflexota bacterium]MYE32738.1 MFS transporter [Chloroflexota bacterium]